MIAFTVRGLPIPQGSTQARVTVAGRPYVQSKSGPLTLWRQAIASAAATTMGDLPVLEGPLQAMIRFHLPRPKTAPKRVKLPATRPDLDKLLRAVLDGCTAVVWRDDAQVVSIHAVKQYAADGVIGAEVKVWEVDT